MVPVVIPSGKKKEKPGKEVEHEKGPQKREREREENAALRRHLNGVSIAAMTLATLGGLLAAVALRQRPVAAVAAALGGSLVGLLLLFALKIARQWERAVVLRLGRFVGLRGRDSSQSFRWWRPCRISLTSACGCRTSLPNPR